MVRLHHVFASERRGENPKMPKEVTQPAGRVSGAGTVTFWWLGWVKPYGMRILQAPARQAVSFGAVLAEGARNWSTSDVWGIGKALPFLCGPMIRCASSSIRFDLFSRDSVYVCSPMKQRFMGPSIIGAITITSKAGSRGVVSLKFRHENPRITDLVPGIGVFAHPNAD